MYRMNDNTTLLTKQAKYTAYLVPHGFKHKHLILLFIIILFVLFLNTGITFRFPSSNLHIEWGFTPKYGDDLELHYFIKTKGCAIPSFPALNSIVEPYCHEVSKVECHNETNPPLIESDDRRLWVIEKNLPNYGVKNTSHFHCFYQAFYRQDSSESRSDDRFIYENETYTFKSEITVHSDFVKVECLNEGVSIYKDYHSFVLPLTKTIFVNDGSQNMFNVLMVGMDSVSRLNFHRAMPKTHSFLKEIGALDFSGYNKVGDNTYPNLVPVLMGLSQDDVVAECVPYKNSTYDDCPLIWKTYKNKGYVTAFAEDAAPISLFNYMKNGFADQPTDYYWRTFDFAAEKDIGSKHKFNANLCTGARLTMDNLLDYNIKFVQTMQRYNTPYFGFFWETSLTHDDLNYARLADYKYLSFMKTLYVNEVLNNTIVVYFSDHGMRWGDIRKTHQGRIEERMPFLFILIPKNFAKQYPLASENIRRNTKRLTTPFDIHEMLVDLSSPSDNLKDTDINLAAKVGKFANSRGVSLFHLIDDSRTCESAEIDDHWCTCNQIKKIPTDDETVLNIANFVVDHMNNLLSGHVQCAKLNLSQVLDATEGTSLSTINHSDVNYISQDFTIILETVPGEGLFEATVRKSHTGFNITGTISRINLYGSQSKCMDNFHLKLYCYCDTSLSGYQIFG